ncbi:hypothetical protein ACCS54_07245 [Rhizobium johnstonii]|uniref:hypothetical protein n=1 Tax=Rhizobium johnstonii TaxID=3019933 RepID=UPI003F9C7508
MNTVNQRPKFARRNTEFGKTRNDTVRFIVREWMEKNTYLPVHELDEDGDVDGSA